jgi:Putative auto-transporter adhesin, head GIN domain
LSFGCEDNQIYLFVKWVATYPKSFIKKNGLYLYLYKLFVMKKILLLATVLPFLICCRFTSGSGNIVSEKRTVSTFNAIKVGGSFDVEVGIGATPELTVEADDNILKYIKTTVENGELKITLENNGSMNNIHLKVFITTPTLEKITASASADVLVKDVIKSEQELSFATSSSADIEAQVDAPAVNTSANSSGTIKISGTTKNHTAEASSSGDIKAFDLLSENTNVSASSSGDAQVHASVTLTAKASSSGDITYRGNAKESVSESSSGSVRKK